MKLNEYMPPFLSDIREFKEIFKSEDEELERLKYMISKMLTEIIINTADSYGITKYEKIYGIVTDEILSDDTRRTNILLKMNNKVPYNKKWLINLLDTVFGKDNYKVIIEEAKYSINIELSLSCSETAEILKKELRNKVPANMKLQYSFGINTNIFTAIVLQETEYITIDTVIKKEENENEF